MNEKTIEVKLNINMEKWEELEKERVKEKLKKNRAYFASHVHPQLYFDLVEMVEKAPKLDRFFYSNTNSVLSKLGIHLGKKFDDIFLNGMNFFLLSSVLKEKEITFTFLEKDKKNTFVCSEEIGKIFLYDKEKKELLEHFDGQYMEFRVTPGSKEYVLQHSMLIQACDDIIKQHI